MRIALDYDGTYTRCPGTWEALISAAQQNGHEVVVITARKPEQKVPELVGLQVYYTSGKAKKDYVDELGVFIDIWIDDAPWSILEDVWTGDS
jgi:hypothetical protein